MQCCHTNAKVIGITGGIGSGKSEVMNILKYDYGAEIILADKVAHKFLMKNGETYNYLIREYGLKFIDSSGEVDRKKLAEFIFSDDNALLKMNEFVHPRVKKAIISSIEKFKKQGKKLIALESALLLEENYNEFCDEIWYIYVDLDIRKQRLIESRNYSLDKINAILKSQLSDEDFKKRCDIVINNSNDLEYTKSQIAKNLIQN